VVLEQLQVVDCLADPLHREWHPTWTCSWCRCACVDQNAGQRRGQFMTSAGAHELLSSDGQSGTGLRCCSAGKLTVELVRADDGSHALHHRCAARGHESAIIDEDDVGTASSRRRAPMEPPSGVHPGATARLVVVERWEGSVRHDSHPLGLRRSRAVVGGCVGRDDCAPQRWPGQPVRQGAAQQQPERASMSQRSAAALSAGIRAVAVSGGPHGDACR